MARILFIAAVIQSVLGQEQRPQPWYRNGTRLSNGMWGPLDNLWHVSGEVSLLFLHHFQYLRDLDCKQRRLARLKGSAILESLRGTQLLFLGDSMLRQVRSPLLMCILRILSLLHDVSGISGVCTRKH